MRSILAVCLSALTLGACGQSDPGQVRSDWGCSPVSGLETITSERTARFILIGESVESNEAPNAIAAIACRLAERGDSVLIGISERTGGMTEAEAGLQRTVDYLAARHSAAISFALFEQPDERIAVRNRSDSERRQAETIVAELDRVGATRAIFLLPRSEAATTSFASAGMRFSGYDPMAAHLPRDEVLSFVVAKPSRGEAAEISLRTYPEPRNGFYGELVLSRLTHPVLPAEMARGRAMLSSEEEWIIDEQESPAEQRARRQREADVTRRVRILASGGEEGLPDFFWDDE